MSGRLPFKWSEVDEVAYEKREIHPLNRSKHVWNKSIAC
jgi:hypothetical protein